MAIYWINRVAYLQTIKGMRGMMMMMTLNKFAAVVRLKRHDKDNDVKAKEKKMMKEKTHKAIRWLFIG